MVPEKINLTLGNDVYAELLLTGMKMFKNSLLSQKKDFGWVVSGPTDRNIENIYVSANVCSLEKRIGLLWEQENLIKK